MKSVRNGSPAPRTEVSPNRAGSKARQRSPFSSRSNQNVVVDDDIIPLDPGMTPGLSRTTAMRIKHTKTSSSRDGEDDNQASDTESVRSKKSVPGPQSHSHSRSGSGSVHEDLRTANPAGRYLKEKKVIEDDIFERMPRSPTTTSSNDFVLPPPPPPRRSRATARPTSSSPLKNEVALTASAPASKRDSVGSKRDKPPPVSTPPRVRGRPTGTKALQQTEAVRRESEVVTRKTDTRRPSVSSASEGTPTPSPFERPGTPHPRTGRAQLEPSPLRNSVTTVPITPPPPPTVSTRRVATDVKRDQSPSGHHGREAARPAESKSTHSSPLPSPVRSNRNTASGDSERIRYTSRFNEADYDELLNRKEETDATSNGSGSGRATPNPSPPPPDDTEFENSPWARIGGSHRSEERGRAREREQQKKAVKWDDKVPKPRNLVKRYFGNDYKRERDTRDAVLLNSKDKWRVV